MEQALDYTFPLILYYRHFPTHEFPTEVMQENYEAGRLVELTLQLTDNNNMDMFAKSPLLEIYRGNMDEQLRSLRRLCSLEGDYEVYPGHMDASTLARERLFNYYCRLAMNA